MTVTKNLEEEVTLRLQFESNLNKLSNQHREVSIELTRTRQQLDVQIKMLEAANTVTAEHSARLLELTHEKTERDLLLQEL